MKIVVNINKRVAILAGQDKAGEQVIDVPDSLTDGQRKELSYWDHNPQGTSLDNRFYLMLRHCGLSDPRNEVFNSLADTEPESVARLLDQLAVLRSAEIAKEEKEEQEGRKRKEDRKRLIEEANEILSLSDLVVERKNGCTAHSKNLSESYSSFSVELPKEGPFKDINSYEFKRRFPKRWDKANEIAERKKKEARKAAQEIVDERAAKAVAERNEWIQAHGSDRLKMILEEGMIETSMAVYRDEKLAVDRPGWIWDATWHDGAVEHNTIRNPTEDDLFWYRTVKKVYPKCEMVYAFLGAEPGDYYENDEDEPRVKEAAITDCFLGKDIVLRKNLNDEERLLRQWKEETWSLLRRSQATTEMASAMISWLTAEFALSRWEPIGDLYKKWEELGEELLKQGGDEALARVCSWTANNCYKP
jgi:hypothetical protein